MGSKQQTGGIVGGAILIVIGLLALLGQLFQGYDFWGSLWPFIVIGVGLMFFVGMLLGGKGAAGLAIPGSIITTIGLILLYQNLSNNWESWSYAWTLILVAVGIGMFIMGMVNGDQAQRRAGLRQIRVGVIMFIIFGAFFEMLFHSFIGSQYLFPVALILVGGYLVMKRSGLFSNRSQDTLNSPDQPTQESK